jgi:hypothetical protein
MRRFAFALGTCVTAALALLAHDALRDHRDLFPDDVDVLYVPPPQHLQPMSLGYREALADLLWVQALVFTGERMGDNDIAAITRYTEAITGLSPRFHQAYVWGGITPIYGGSSVVDRDMVDRAIAMYRRGLEQFPESHKLLYPFGMLLTHQVPSTPGYSDEEKLAAKREGAELIRRAAAFGADPLVRQYAATIITDHATEQMARQFLESQLATAEGDDYRRMLRRKLERMGAHESIQEIERTREAFLREQLEQLPYASDTVYAVIRDEHAEAR